MQLKTRFTFFHLCEGKILKTRGHGGFASHSVDIFHRLKKKEARKDRDSRLIPSHTVVWLPNLASQIWGDLDLSGAVLVPLFSAPSIPG